MTPTFIVALIVTYHPDIPTINQLIAKLEHQTDFILVIDNATPEFTHHLLRATTSAFKVIHNQENWGLAKAYNQGLAFAQQHQASHILLLDQDSLPADNMISELTKVLADYNSDGLQVAAAGPKYTDLKGQADSPFVRLKGFHLERVECAENEVVAVDHLISSGSLIDLRAIQQVGQFTDALFIDYVDTEWCWRARCKKLILLGVGSAKMQHNLGESHFIAFGKALILHSPFRLYYQMRNRWWMIFQPWVGWRWRLMDIMRSAKIFCAFALCAPERMTRITYMCKGIMHAIRSRMGKLQE